MVAKVKANELFNGNARQVTEDMVGLEELLNALTGPGLGERIAEAARLAVAEHMLQATQEMQSEVETESSTK